MSEPEWKRQSRLKEQAWRWAARRLELEVVTDELEGKLTEDERQMLDHVRKVVCKTLLRQGERVAQRRKGTCHEPERRAPSRHAATSVKDRGASN